MTRLVARTGATDFVSRNLTRRFMARQVRVGFLLLAPTGLNLAPPRLIGYASMLNPGRVREP